MGNRAIENRVSRGMPVPSFFVSDIYLHYTLAFCLSPIKFLVCDFWKCQFEKLICTYTYIGFILTETSTKLNVSNFQGFILGTIYQPCDFLRQISVFIVIPTIANFVPCVVTVLVPSNL